LNLPFKSLAPRGPKDIYETIRIVYDKNGTGNLSLALLPSDSSMRFCTSFVAILSWVLVAFAMGADVESYQNGIGHPE
jgi:hypothetical protein